MDPHSDTHRKAQAWQTWIPKDPWDPLRAALLPERGPGILSEEDANYTGFREETETHEITTTQRRIGGVLRHL